MNKGLTLIETLVGVAIFLIVAVSVWQGVAKTLEALSVLRTKNVATTLANELFEVVRNMPYENVGIVDGLPPGNIPKIQTIQKDGRLFEVVASVVNIDDPFDGEIGGIPNDLSPADNKLVEFIISCLNCEGIYDLDVTTKVAPRNLESSGNNGALFIQVVNANGDPVQGADIKILNEDNDPFILVQETTDNYGMFKLIDAPPGTEVYQIEATKDGYSTDKTYESGAIENPVPNKPHANVSTGLVTQITFAIDELSSIDFNAKNVSCSNIGGLELNFYGEKTIGENVLKHEYQLITNSSGNISIDNVEWDTYHVDFNDETYYLSGSNPFLPIDINPGSSNSIDLIVDVKNSNALLVRVIDGNEGIPVANAKVDLTLSDTETLYTGQGSFSQNDWSGGSGQADWVNENRYYSQDGNIDDSNEELKLVNFGTNFTTNGEITSSTYDVGSSVNFINLNWSPGAQIEEVGENSVKLQIATNEEITEETAWEFKGPDGTSSTYYTNSGQTIHASHDGDRFVRYKVLLSTEDNTVTPILSDVSFSFTNGCTPAGQVYFDGLENDTYEIRVSKDGYQDYYTEEFNINNEWQSLDVILQSS